MTLFYSKTKLLTRLINFRPQNHNRLISSSLVKFSQKVIQEEDENAPIKFSTSKAAKWKAEKTRTGEGRQAPWFEPYSVIVSLAVFMLYFFVLREESDVDTEFDQTLYDRIAGMEEKQVQIALKYNIDNNLPTKELRERLEEIRKENN